MSNDLDNSGEARETVEQKLDKLSASVDDRFARPSASVDERFDAVTVALAEQRQYTEFAFDRLSDEMRNGFETIAGRLDGVDAQFKSVDDHFSRVDGHLNSIDSRLDRVDNRFDRLDSRFDRLERKLDQFIDTQSATNKLVERRLTVLEPRSADE